LEPDARARRQLQSRFVALLLVHLVRIGVKARHGVGACALAVAARSGRLARRAGSQVLERLAHILLVPPPRRQHAPRGAFSCLRAPLVTAGVLSNGSADCGRT
jgi:hypothetical protein